MKYAHTLLLAALLSVNAYAEDAEPASDDLSLLVLRRVG